MPARKPLSPVLRVCAACISEAVKKGNSPSGSPKGPGEWRVLQWSSEDLLSWASGLEGVKDEWLRLLRTAGWGGRELAGASHDTLQRIGMRRLAPRRFLLLARDKLAQKDGAWPLTPGGEVERREDLSIYDSEQVPSCGYLSYLKRWMRYAHSDENVPVLAFIYIDRMCDATGLQLTNLNVYNVMLSALLLAEKWTRNKAFDMSHYAAIGAVDVARLHQLEAAFLSHLDWDLHVDLKTHEERMAAFRAHPEWVDAGKDADTPCTESAEG